MGRYISPEITRITDGVQGGVVPQDEYTESLVTISDDKNKVNSGKSFFTNYNVTLGLGGTLEILAITANNALVVSLEDLIVGTGETQLDVYIGTTFTSNGTALTIANRNGLSINTATLTTFHTPTVNVLGALAYTTTWGSGSKQGAIRDGFPAILAPVQTYLFRITSIPAGNTVTHELHWSEDTNRNP